MSSECKPICIFLVSSGSRGDRLLFRYPFESSRTSNSTEEGHSSNPYALRITEDFRHTTTPKSAIEEGQLVGYSDATLAHLFAVKSGLCGAKFELKADDVRFVSHPTLLHGQACMQPTPKRETPTMILFSVVFALHVSADRILVSYYNDLSRRLAIALRHEERRSGYLTNQQILMLAAHDEASEMPEDSMTSAFKLMLSRSQLANELKITFNDLCKEGVVDVHINHWARVSFCLPHIAHNKHHKDMKIDPVVLKKCLNGLRPYHGMLLLEEESVLMETLPSDSSPALARLIRISSPLKSLTQLACDADLTLCQIFQLVSHLVYWAKATIIYPLCDSNVYILSPSASTSVNSHLTRNFKKVFTNTSLPATLAEFSLPTPLGEHVSFGLDLSQQKPNKIEIVVWLLRQRMLMQLHTYVFLIADGQTGKSKAKKTYGQNKTLLASEESLSEDNDRCSKRAISPNQREDNDDMIEQRLSQDDVVSELSLAERSCILHIEAARNIDDLKLFLRLCPYFRGKHHFEEIMYCENLRRSQLLMVVEKFRDVLVTCVHEDPSVVFFQTTRSITT